MKGESGERVESGEGASDLLSSLIKIWILAENLEMIGARIGEEEREESFGKRGEELWWNQDIVLIGRPNKEEKE